MSRCRVLPRAFTLIELLMVVALVGVLAGFAITNATPALHERLEAAAEILVSDLAYVRSQAVSANSEYRLTFDLTHNRYLLTHSGANALLNQLPSSPFWSTCELTNTQCVNLAEMPLAGAQVKLFAVLANSASPIQVSYVEFSPLGGTVRSEDTLVWLSIGTGRETRYLPVRINPITGLAEAGEMTAFAPVVLQVIEGTVGTALPLNGGAL